MVARFPGIRRVAEFCDHARMPTSTKKKRLIDGYRFAGFRALEEIKGVFGDPRSH